MNKMKEMTKEEKKNLRTRCDYLEMKNFNLQKKLDALRDEYRKKVKNY